MSATRATALSLCLLFLGSAPILGASASQTDGKALFLEKKCDLCHSVDSEGIARRSDKMKGPDLSDAASLIASPEWAKAYLLRQEETKEGKKHRREFKGTPEELDAIVEWLLTLKKS